MLEIEVKSPYDDLEELERKLRSMGARFKAEIEQADIYLGHPCRDFKETDEALRIRRENEDHVLYYKGPKLDKETKTREEISSPIADPEAMVVILERLGFKKVWEVKKRRKVYGMDDIEICLDRVTDLGNFVELEVNGPSIEEGKKKLFALMNRLDIKESVRESYLELLMKKKNGV